MTVAVDVSICIVSVLVPQMLRALMYALLQGLWSHPRNSRTCRTQTRRASCFKYGDPTTGSAGCSTHRRSSTIEAVARSSSSRADSRAAKVPTLAEVRCCRHTLVVSALHILCPRDVNGRCLRTDVAAFYVENVFEELDAPNEACQLHLLVW